MRAFGVGGTRLQRTYMHSMRAHKHPCMQAALHYILYWQAAGRHAGIHLLHQQLVDEMMQPYRVKMPHTLCVVYARVNIFEGNTRLQHNIHILWLGRYAMRSIALDHRCCAERCHMWATHFSSSVLTCTALSMASRPPGRRLLFRAPHCGSMKNHPSTGRRLACACSVCVERLIRHVSRSHVPIQLTITCTHL